MCAECKMVAMVMAVAVAVAIVCLATSEAFQSSLHPPRVLAISLQREHRRRARLSAQAPCVEYVAAVDGATLPAPATPQPVEGERELTRGEVGCFLSHVRAWRRVIAIAEPVVVVVEDDANVSLPEQWPAIMRAINSLPRGWDLLFLGLNNPDRRAPEVAPGVRRLQRDAYGMHAVVFSQRAARTMLRRFSEVGMCDDRGVRLPLDVWVSRLSLYMYWADPVLVTPFDLKDSETQRVR